MKTIELELLRVLQEIITANNPGVSDDLLVEKSEDPDEIEAAKEDLIELIKEL